MEFLAGFITGLITGIGITLFAGLMYQFYLYYQNNDK